MNSQLESQVAMYILGLLHQKGQGVPQSYERAAELYKQGAAGGNAVSQRDQAHFHMQFLQIFSFKFCFMNGRTHLHCQQPYLTKRTDRCTNSNSSMDELCKQGAELGNAVSQRDQAQLHMQILQKFFLSFRRFQFIFVNKYSS